MNQCWGLTTILVKPKDITLSKLKATSEPVANAIIEAITDTTSKPPTNV